MKFHPLAHPFATVIAVLACAAPAFAEDACLVGKWQPQGNAAAEWMRRNAPGTEVSVNNQSGAVEFRADGSYAAGGSADVAMSGPGGKRASTQDARFHSQGTWSAERGTLTLRPTRETASGRMQIAAPDGRRISVPMPTGATQPQSLRYTCNGASLETRMAIPNATPIVQRYRRAR